MKYFSILISIFNIFLYSFLNMKKRNEYDTIGIKFFIMIKEINFGIKSC